jgi:ABC-type anion transport system duplicated permease subunit
MSKNRVVTLLALLVLAAAILFLFYEKRHYSQRVAEIKQERAQIEKIATLKTLWGAKGMQKKLNLLFKRVPNANRERLKIDRNKADIKIHSLNEKQINYLLTKLAMLPVSFKKLNITRSGNSFTLEALCVW